MPLRSVLAPVISVMRVHQVIVSPDMSLAAAQAVFESRGVRHLLVARPGRRLVGMLNIGDLVLAAHLERGSPSARVSDVMTPRVQCLSPDDSLSVAIALFLRESSHAAAVLDEGDVVGLVTSHDIMGRVFADVLPLGGQALGRHLLQRTPV